MKRRDFLKAALAVCVPTGLAAPNRYTSWDILHIKADPLFKKATYTFSTETGRFSSSSYNFSNIPKRA